MDVRRTELPMTIYSGGHDEGYIEIISGIESVTDEELEAMKKPCTDILENGYKFRFVIISSFIDDLLNSSAVTQEALQNIKSAIKSLVPYALNLYNYPDQNEYKVIKMYTAYFCCNIKDKLGPAYSIAETLLTTMGYKHSMNDDEMVLTKVSRSIFEILFELFLVYFELDRIITVVDYSSALYGHPPSKTVQLLQEFWKNGTWQLKDYKKHLQERFGKGSQGKTLKTAGFLPSCEDKGKKMKICEKKLENMEEWMYDDDKETQWQPIVNQKVSEDNIYEDQSQEDHRGNNHRHDEYAFKYDEYPAESRETNLLPERNVMFPSSGYGKDSGLLFDKANLKQRKTSNLKSENTIFRPPTDSLPHFQSSYLSEAPTRLKSEDMYENVMEVLPRNISDTTRLSTTSRYTDSEWYEPETVIPSLYTQDSNSSFETDPRD